MCWAEEVTMSGKTLLAGLVVCLAASTLLAQDPVKVDAKHYKVEFETTRCGS
jgi:hypothetical protein